MKSFNSRTNRTKTFSSKKNGGGFMKKLTSINHVRLFACLVLLLGVSIGISAVLVRRASAERTPVATGEFAASPNRMLVLPSSPLLVPTVKTVCNTGTPDFATLAAAVTDANTNFPAGNVTYDVCAGFTETAPAGGYIINSTGSVGNEIIFEKSGAGANPTITASAALTPGALNDGIFKIIGGDFVTIDGFTMLENPANTITAAGTNNMTEWGVALLYATTTNGAQNNTIKNCTIDLDRTYQNTFGIYSNSTHSATAVTTSATATTAAGGNSGLKIYSNMITDVNQGIVVVGPTAAADNNDGIDIGGVALGTGNTITNYGTTATFSGYANVSGTVYGVLVRNSKNYNISFNSITSSSGATGVTVGTLRGIYVPSATNQPTGTFTNNVNNNTLAVTSHVLAGAINGISVESTTSSPTSTTNINANNFTTLNHTIAAASGAVTAIIQSGSATAGPLVTSVSNNLFTNIVCSSTGAFTFISDSFTTPAGGTKNINSNSIVTGFNKTGAGGTVTILSDNGSDPGPSNINNFNNNDFSNISLTGATTFAGISSTNGPSATAGPTKSVTGNTVSNLTGGTSAITVITTNFDGGPTTVSGNTISNITGGGSITGMTFGTGTTRTVSKNSVKGLNGTAAASVVIGMVVTNTTSPSTFTIVNNIVGALTAPAATGSNAIIGISITGSAATSTVNAYFNTVNLNNLTSGAGFGSSGFSTLASSTATTSTLNLRNNIIVNTSIQNGAGLTVAYRRSSGTASTLANYANTSNNNLFYAGTPSATNLIYSDGTSSAQTIAAYRTGVFTAGTIAPRDNFSVSEAPPFLSTTITDPTFLHISGATPTQIESGGQPIAGVTDDFDNQARNASFPDIGADEFTGMIIDGFGPAINYTPLANTASTGDRVLSASVLDPSGVPTAGIGLPVIYYRKNAGSYVSSQCVSAGGGIYNCTISATALGGVVPTDLVGYYMAAQDNSGNVSVVPAGGAGGFTTNPPAASTPPTTPSTYTIVNAVSGNISVPTTFTSISNPGGVFEFINNNQVTGDVVIQVGADLTGETGSVSLNEFAAPFTVTIRPTGAPHSITGSGAGLSVIRLNGADRFTIDGSLTVGGSTRDLTIVNPNTATSGAIFIGSIGAGAGATDVTVKNCIIQAGGIGTTANFTFGFFVGNTSGAAAGPDNDNLTIQNNVISRARTGIQTVGDPSGLNDNTQIINNVIGDDVIGVSIGRQGINIGSSNTATIRGNTIKNIFLGAVDSATPFGIVTGPLTNSLITQNTIDTVRSTGTSGNLSPYGIILSTGTANTSVTRNNITNIQYTATSGFGGKGIEVNTGAAASNITIANNFVSNITGDGWNSSFPQDMICGIRVFGSGTGGVKVYNNSVSLGTGTFAGNTSGNTSAAFYAPATAVGVDLRDNILFNNLDNSASATDKNYALYSDAANTAYTDINYNDYWVPVSSATGPQVLFFLGSDRLLLSDIQTATGKDANSISMDPLFVSMTNLHLGAGSPAIGTAQTIATVIDDIDGDGRPGNLAAEIGADEIPDTNAPDTSITSFPMNPSNSSSATFAFSGTDTFAPEVVASFECKLDAGMFATCTSPTTLMGLSDGSHTFQVRAKDFNGNVDPSPAGFAWVVDTTAPDTSILTNPTNPTTALDATFTFSGNDGAGSGIASFECKLDMGAFGACTSPQTYMGLSLGSHTFMVRAIDNAGNPDATPASFTWTINGASVGPVTVTSTAGTTSPTDYMTLKLAFDAINAGTHQGVITVDIVSSTDEGATPATLNSTGAGSASYTSINIRPTSDGVTITGAPGQGFGVIQLNGVDNVTLDGDNPNTAGTNRNLTVSNTTTATVTAGSVVRIATSATPPYDSNNNDTIKNLILNGNVTGGNLASITSAAGSSNLSFGIIAGPNGGASVTAITAVAGAMAAGVTVNSLLIDNNVVNQAGRGIAFIGSGSASSTGVTISNNTVGAAGALVAYPYTTPSSTVYTKGVYVQGTNAITISGNTVRNILSYIATPLAGIELNSGLGSGTISVANNTVTGVSLNASSANSARGISVLQAGGPYTISGNTVSDIHNLCSSTTITNQPSLMFVGTTATSATIENNKFSTVFDHNAGTFGVSGVHLGGGNNITFRNNFISDVNQDWSGAAAFSTTFGTFGLRINAGTGHKIYHNSINLFGTAANVDSLLSAAISINTALTGIDVRNNILSNTITGGTTSIAHVSLWLPSGATSAMNLTLNNNAYFSGTDAARQGIGQAGTTAGVNFYIAGNFDPTMTSPASNMRAYTSTLSAAGTNDNASFASTAAAPFTTSTNLHIPNGTATRLESGGAAGTGVTVDIDNEMRNVTTPDIGADEFSGVAPPANDIAATAIVVPANGGVVVAGGTVTPQATFSNVGLAAQTNVMVKFTITGPGGYNYTDTQVIPSIGSGSTLPVTFAVTPTFTTVGNYVSTALVMTPDSNAGNDMVTGGFMVKTALSGTYTVGSGGDFTSLTNPGGVFDNINSLGATSNLVINITSDLSGETGSVPLNQVAGGFTVTIKPSGAARSITSTATAISVIKLSDADNVTIDGSLSGASDRSLTITNTNTAGSTTVIWLGSATNGCQNNTIKNLNLAGGTDQSVTNAFNFGIISSTSASILTGGTDNDNNTYRNNFIKKVSVGIISIGGLATNMNEGTVINNNLIGPAAFGSDEVSTLGILIFNENAPQVTGNELRFIGDGATTGGSSGRDHVGISLCTGSASWAGSAAPGVVGTVTNGNISGNRIHDIVERATFSAVGIVENCTNGGLATNNTISNNFIYNILANGTSPDQAVGIGLANGNTDTVAFNSVYMTGDIDPAGATTATISSFGISVAFATNTNLTLKDNISVMDINSNTGALLHSAINVQSTTFNWGTGGSNFNNWFAPAANTQARVGTTGGTAGVFYATLAAWQTATSQDASSFSVDPTFVSGTDLHLMAGSPMINVGMMTVPAITTDIDGDTRPSGAGPEIGADEIVEGGAPGVLQFSSPTYSIGEAGVQATITVSRTGGSTGMVGVSYATVAGGNATGGAACGGTVDYVNTSGTLSFPDMNASQSFNIPICNDTLNELNETVNLAISMPTGGATIGAQSTAVLTIVDDDPVPTLAVVSPSPQAAPEQNSGSHPVTFMVNLSTASGKTVTVHYQTNDGTATVADNDYVGIPDTLMTFNPGQTSMPVNVLVNGDTTPEPDETFTLDISTPVNATISTPSASATILNDDGGGPTITIDDVRTKEGNSGTHVVTFTAKLTCPGACPPVTVHYATSNGTATAGSDYVAIPDTLLSFSPTDSREGGSQMLTRPINVTINGDVNKEPNETFHVDLFNATGASLSDNQGVGIIFDEDRAYVADFDRDLKTDLSVFRPVGDQTNAVWYVSQSSNGVTKYEQWGANGDKIVPGDYDGDGITDMAVYRPSTGTWFIERSSDFGVIQVQWGLSNDLPVQGDYDGDNKTDIAVYRPSNGVWYIRRSSDLTLQAMPFGASGDKVIPGDYNGDGMTDFAVFRPSSGTWYIQPSGPKAPTISFAWGASGDMPVVGDFDGDGSSDIAVFRPSNGNWYIRTSLNGGTITEHWGQSGDIPVVGDYDGDGISDIAVWRPSTGNWYVLNSNDPAPPFAPDAVIPTFGHWGQSGDKPVPAAYVPEQ